MRIREKKHRMSREFYRGQISVAFTLCLRGKLRLFESPQIVQEFVNILESVVPEYDCIAPVYCFMPDHQHLILTGTKDTSDIWKAVVNYKQKTGFLMAEYGYQSKWQKDFYDHALRSSHEIVLQVKYILDNPVRKGLAVCWHDYSFKGSVGCKLEDVLVGLCDPKG